MMLAVNHIVMDSDYEISSPVSVWSMAKYWIWVVAGCPILILELDKTPNQRICPCDVYRFQGMVTRPAIIEYLFLGW